MNEGLMVAVFVARAELKMAVEEEAKIIFEACENQMLVSGISRKNNLIGVNIVFRGCGDVAGFRDAGAQSAQHHQASDAQAVRTRELAGKKKSAPDRDGSINQAKEHGRTNQPQTRHEQNGKQERGAERAEIVKSQNVSDNVAKVVAILNDAHQQRDFQPHEDTHYYDQGIENEFEALGERKCQHQ